jgi:hypothetical protein
MNLCKETLGANAYIILPNSILELKVVSYCLHYCVEFWKNLEASLNSFGA